MEESLRQVDLEDIARVNEFDGAFNRAEIVVFAEVARELRRRRDGELRREFVGGNRLHGARRRKTCRLRQQLLELRETSRGPLLASHGIALRKALADDPRRLLLVIEGHDDVVQPDGKRRDAKLIEARRGEPFETLIQVITAQPRRPALKRR
jgi:hypothetical protein